MKKLKLDDIESSNKETADATSSSPIVSSAADNSKYEAKLANVSKQTLGLVNNFGISWFKVLETEFSKPYFLKVLLNLSLYLSI